MAVMSVISGAARRLRGVAGPAAPRVGGPVSRLRAADGSALPWMIVLVAVAVALILTGAAVTSVYSERTRLYALADAAAVVAAQSFALDDVTIDGAGAGAADDAAGADGTRGAVDEGGAAGSGDVGLDESRVRRAVEQYLVSTAEDARLRHPADDPLAGRVRIVDAVPVSEDGVRVRLAVVWRPAMAFEWVPMEVPIEVDVSARSIVR